MSSTQKATLLHHHHVRIQDAWNTGLYTLLQLSGKSVSLLKGLKKRKFLENIFLDCKHFYWGLEYISYKEP